MSKSTTPPLGNQNRLTKRCKGSIAPKLVVSERKRLRSLSTSTSTSSSENAEFDRKMDRKKRKSRSRVRSKRTRSPSTSDSSMSSQRYRKKSKINQKNRKRSKSPFKSLRRTRRHSSDTKTESSILKKLAAALESKNHGVGGHGIQNILPEFDPQSKNQTMEDWIRKVNESAQVYGWSEKQTIYFALPRLSGLAKRWYDGLTSVKFSWDEWQTKLLKAFPCEENFGDLLTEMLARKSLRNETLEEYYYDKIRLINRCGLTGRKAVDCLTHGIFNHNIRMNAQGANFSQPEDLLTYFRKISQGRREESSKFKSFDHRVQHRTTDLQKRAVNSENQNSTPNNFQKQTVDTEYRQRCFNCKENGHHYEKCPKTIVKCNKCQRIGHTYSNCLQNNKDISKKINTNSNLTKNVLKIDSDSVLGDKYFKDVKINNKILKGFVDLGSECTLISDEVELDSAVQINEGLPLLKGFANGTIQPHAKIEICVQIDDLQENIIAYIVPQHLLPKNVSILIGQNLTELPNVRVYKTDKELILFKSFDQPVKIMIRNTIEVNGVTTVPVQIEQFPMKTNLYVTSDICLKPDSEYIILPGVYPFESSKANIVIIGLTPSSIKLPQGKLVARGIILPNFLFKQESLRVLQEHEKKEFNVCRIAEESTVDPIQLDEINTDFELNKNIKSDLCQLLNENRECFAFSTAELGKTTLTEMRIKLKDESPVIYRPYRMSFPEREKVKQIIEDLCDNGIIRESSSEYASPVIVVPKKTVWQIIHMGPCQPHIQPIKAYRHYQYKHDYWLDEYYLQNDT